MRGSEDKVSRLIYQCPLSNGVAAPEKEDEACTLLAEGLDGGISKGFPAMVLVAACLVGTDGEGGIEEEYPLVSPAAKVAICFGDVNTEIGVDFGDDIHQRGRHLYALRYREAETHGLAGLMVGVLTKDDHLHAVERRGVEGVENLAAGRVAGMLRPFGDKELLELCEIWGFKLWLQHRVPAGVYLYHKVIKDLKDTWGLKDFILKRNYICVPCRFGWRCHGRGRPCSRRAR